MSNKPDFGHCRWDSSTNPVVRPERERKGAKWVESKQVQMRVPSATEPRLCSISEFVETPSNVCGGERARPCSFAGPGEGPSIG